MSLETNDQLILVSGFSGTGKSASLRNIRNQEKWLYLNTEAGKRLPFRNKFQHGRITDPYQVTDAFTYAIENPNDVDGIIVDSLTFMMDMYESMYVLNAANTMAAWSNFAQFFKYLMQDRVILFGKPVIFGPKYQKFHEAVELIEAGGAFSIRDAKQLAKKTVRLVTFPELLKKTSATCADYVQRKKGATDIILSGMKETN